ncbi:hypothetical protein SDJN03_22828, partial [Cucurbita argyrosperma subsp. sororia]
MEARSRSRTVAVAAAGGVSFREEIEMKLLFLDQSFLSCKVRIRTVNTRSAEEVTAQVITAQLHLLDSALCSAQQAATFGTKPTSSRPKCIFWTQRYVWPNKLLHLELSPSQKAQLDFLD